jgi:hypothetical protein
MSALKPEDIIFLLKNHTSMYMLPNPNFMGLPSECDQADSWERPAFLF